MSGSFFLGENTLFVSNRRLTTLVEFVLVVADDQATTAEARSFLDRFKIHADAFFPGIDIDLEELFPSSSERTFWSDAFAELAKRIERRQIRNTDQHDWRPEAADQAMQVSRMLRSGLAPSPARSICERIIAARGGDLIVRIEVGTLDSAASAARLFGLLDSPDIYFEIPRAEAKSLLMEVLARDMAYGIPLVSPKEASELADAFVDHFERDDPRYFTNGEYGRARAHPNIGPSWMPATEHTFDTGILVLANHCVGCAWFMDED